MFKISASSEYALILVKHLSERPGLRTLETVSSDTGIPLPMLRKVSNRLERAGIVESKKGRAGGIGLRAGEFSVKDVLVAAGENLSIAVCSGKEGCVSSGKCSIAPIVRNLQRGFETILAITKL